MVGAMTMELKFQNRHLLKSEKLMSYSLFMVGVGQDCIVLNWLETAVFWLKLNNILKRACFNEVGQK